MSSNIPVWDSTHIQFDNNEIQFDNPYEPWKNIIKQTKTVTTSIKGIQETLYKEHKNKDNLLKEADIAKALADRNILRLTHTIQISSNKQFLAITFQNKQIMETFYSEPLLVKGFTITFSPKNKTPKTKTLLNISFINIPAETPDEPLTEYLQQYADIVGTPLHIQKDYNGIPYYTGTRVYQVNRLYQHIPRQIKDMFGRTILCIYDNQHTDNFKKRNNTKKSYYYKQRTTRHYPTQNKEDTTDDNYSDSENESESENQKNQQQQETTTTTTNENQQQYQIETQNQTQKETTNSQQQQENVTIRKHKTTPTTQYQINKESPPKTNENYPEIQNTTPAKENKPSTPPIQQQQQQQQQNDITIIPETQLPPQTQTQETTQISFNSPSMVTKNRYQILHSTPETVDITTPENSEPNNKENTFTPTPQHEQHQKAKTFAMRLYRMNFADTGSFVNATFQEKENITALAMYYTLGDYDPSNKFVTTFRNKDIIETYKIITEAKTTKTNTLSRIYKHLNAMTNRVEQRNLAKKKQ